MTDKYIKQIDEAVEAKYKRNHDSLIESSTGLKSQPCFVSCEHESDL